MFQEMSKKFSRAAKNQDTILRQVYVIDESVFWTLLSVFILISYKIMYWKSEFTFLSFVSYNEKTTKQIPKILSYITLFNYKMNLITFHEYFMFDLYPLNG